MKMFYLLIGIIICLLWFSGDIKNDDDIQNIEHRYAKKIDSLQLQLNAIKHEKKLLRDSIQKLTTGIEKRDEEYIELRTTLQTGKEKLKKIQSLYETLEMPKNYSTDSIRSFFSSRFSSGQ